MQRILPPSLAAVFLAALLTSPPSHAQIHKCVDASGHVSYTDHECPQSATQETTDVDISRRPGAGALRSEDDDADERGREQARQYAEYLETRRREAQGQCNAGDQKACATLACIPLLTGSESAEDQRACAKAQGFEATASWAQMNRVHGSPPARTVTVTCLDGSHVTEVRGTKFWQTVVMRVNFAGEWYADNLHDMPFDTWEAAADAACR